MADRKCPRHSFRFQAADGVKGECHLGFQDECGMAAGGDEPQTVSPKIASSSSSNGATDTSYLKTDPDELHNLAIDTSTNSALILRQNELLNRLIAREVGNDNGSFLPAALRKS